MRFIPLVLVLALSAAGCAEEKAAGSSDEPVAAVERTFADPTAAPSATASPSTAAPTAAGTASTTTTSASTTTTSTSTSTTTTTQTTVPVVEPPPFESSVAPVTEAELGGSWRPECPVGIDDLRALTLRHHTPGGGTAEGVLVVHRDHADALVGVFASMYAARFPVTSMRPVSDFGADDDRSMAADNTSAFNCREVAGRPGVWSQHSYGTAVDINPLVNPWVRGSSVDPPAGAPYADRSADAAGMIIAGDAVTAAFSTIGWVWGGTWSSAKDYQHFSANGR